MLALWGMRGSLHSLQMEELDFDVTYNWLGYIIALALSYTFNHLDTIIWTVPTLLLFLKRSIKNYVYTHCASITLLLGHDCKHLYLSHPAA